MGSNKLYRYPDDYIDLIVMTKFEVYLIRDCYTRDRQQLVRGRQNLCTVFNISSQLFISKNTDLERMSDPLKNLLYNINSLITRVYRNIYLTNAQKFDIIKG